VTWLAIWNRCVISTLAGTHYFKPTIAWDCTPRREGPSLRRSVGQQLTSNALACLSQERSAWGPAFLAGSCLSGPVFFRAPRSLSTSLPGLPVLVFFKGALGRRDKLRVGGPAFCAGSRLASPRLVSRQRLTEGWPGRLSKDRSSRADGTVRPGRSYRDPAFPLRGSSTLRGSEWLCRSFVKQDRMITLQLDS